MDPAAKDMNPDQKYLLAFHPHGVMAELRPLIDGVIGDHLPNLRSYR